MYSTQIIPNKLRATVFIDLLAYRQEPDGSWRYYDITGLPTPIGKPYRSKRALFAALADVAANYFALAG